MAIRLIITLGFFVALTVFGLGSCRASYQYEAEVASEWYLADRSSTIPAKRQHLDKYVATVGQQGLEGRHNALIYPTAANAFDTNFAALKTLQARLHEIETMDIRSFEYQTAIQQITQQEQGEAGPMLSHIQGSWFLKHYPLYWEWVQILIAAFLSVGLFIAGMVTLFYAMDRY